MELAEFYENVGGNYNDTVSRLMSDVIIRKFVLKFKDDPTYSELVKAKKTGDIAAAFLAAHTIKGTAANLGLDMLASALTEELRNADTMPKNEYFEAVDEAYRVTVEEIKLLV